MKRQLSVVLVLVALVAMIGTAQAQDPVTISYVMWDTNQLPPYQECAIQFQAANPGIVVDVQQLGWDDYWTAITTGFVSGEAPDVFTNHLAKYPEFATLEQIVDIQPMVERDGVATDIYYPGLADLWTRDGRRYGLPKDWDTVAVVYNKALFEAAGVDPAVMAEWTWNPDDGGTYGQTLAQLTLDANGNNALSPDFDKENIAQYGYAGNGMGGPYGQTEWSWLSNTTGWTHNDGVWGSKYNYDDPRFISTIQWLANLWLEQGIAQPLEEQSSLGRTALFQAGNVATIVDGSWMIGTYLASEFEVGFARLPIGPEGRRSMFNGLADSIYVGTPHMEEAWAWVKFLGSAECQNIVGTSGVVFPAIPESAALSLNARLDKGIDISAFVDQANEEGGTFLFPITDFGGEINTIMVEAMDRVGLGEGAAADILPAANAEVNALFE
jgi:multiple sugar transport system substrate-binding protein